MDTTIATINELAAVIPLKDVGRADQDELLRVLKQVVGMCHRYTGRRFEPDPPLAEGGDDTGAPVTYHFPVRWHRSRFVKIPDLRVATAVTLDGSALIANSGYFLGGAFGGDTTTTVIELGATARTTGAGDLAITGRWGMLECPDEIKGTILEYGARKWRQKDARWGDTVQATEQSAFTYFKSIPEEIRDIWNLYRIPNLAVV